MSEETYYRVDARLLEIGDVITGEGALALTVDYPELEALLEERRPSRCLTRTKCVYISQRESAKTMGVKEPENKHYYEVKPLGPVQKRDVGWIGALQMRSPKSAENPNESVPSQLLRAAYKRKFEIYANLKDFDLADKYWSGEPSVLRQYEYVTERAEILRKIIWL